MISTEAPHYLDAIDLYAVADLDPANPNVAASTEDGDPEDLIGDADDDEPADQ